MSLIYKVTNNINEKSYIGFTSKKLNKRKFQHKQYALQRNSPFAFHQAIRKYGWENFKWDVIYESWDDPHCLNTMEPYFIEEYNTFGKNGYNMDRGGRNGMLGIKRKPTSEETKQKIKNTLKAKGIKGENHPMWGKRHTPETIERFKFKKTMLGKHHSEETKKKMSESTKEFAKNNKTGMFGKKHTIETKQKMRIKRMQSWELYIGETKEIIKIDDLMSYCQLNNLQYKTVYAWKYQKVNGVQRLIKVN